MANPWMSNEDADDAYAAANPWLSDEYADETHAAASHSPWLSYEGASETDGIRKNGEHSDNLSDVSSDAPLEPEDDEELQALHERDFGSAGPAETAAAAIAPFVSLYPPDLPLTTLTQFEVDPLKMEIFSKGLAEASRRTCSEPGYLNSADFQRSCNLAPGETFLPTGPIIGQAGVAKAAPWTSEEEPDYRHSSISQRREHSAISDLVDCAKSEQYHDEDDRKPAAVDLSDTHAAKLEAHVYASVFSQSKASKDDSSTTRKRARDATSDAAISPASLNEEKNELTRTEEQDDHKRSKTDPEVEEKAASLDLKAHNVLNFAKVTRMDLLHAAGNNSSYATFISSMLMDGTLKSFMVLSMWHQCNHSVEHELRRKGKVGPFVSWRKRHLALVDPLHKHCVIKSLCRIANYFEPEGSFNGECKINPMDASVSASAGNSSGCVSYEVLVSNDVDRCCEVVELSSWISREAYWNHATLCFSRQDLYESKCMVDVLCDSSKQKETFWISNHPLVS
jgi:quinol monooxygenase YgiN